MRNNSTLVFQSNLKILLFFLSLILLFFYFFFSNNFFASFPQDFVTNAQSKLTSGIRARFNPPVVYHCRGADFIKSQVD